MTLETNKEDMENGIARARAVDLELFGELQGKVVSYKTGCDTNGYPIWNQGILGRQGHEFVEMTTVVTYPSSTSPRRIYNKRGIENIEEADITLSNHLLEYINTKLENELRRK